MYRVLSESFDRNFLHFAFDLTLGAGAGLGSGLWALGCWLLASAGLSGFNENSKLLKMQFQAKFAQFRFGSGFKVSSFGIKHLGFSKLGLASKPLGYSV